MSRLKYALLGLILIAVAGCSTAKREAAQQPPAQQVAQQAAPETTPQLPC
jgi:hypothetical protein